LKPHNLLFAACCSINIVTARCIDEQFRRQMCVFHCEPFTSIFQLLLMAQGKKSAADHYAKGIICVYIKAHLRLTGWTSDPTSGGTNIIHTQTKRSLALSVSTVEQPRARAKKIACRQRFVRRATIKPSVRSLKRLEFIYLAGGSGERCNIMASSPSLWMFAEHDISRLHHGIWRFDLCRQIYRYKLSIHHYERPLKKPLGLRRRCELRACVPPALSMAEQISHQTIQSI